MTGLHGGFNAALQVLRDPKVQPADLYEAWWSGTAGEARLPAVELAFHPEQRARRLQTDHGYHVHSLGGIAVALVPGEFISAGEKVSVIKRLATWSTDHWNWRRSPHPRPYPSTDEIVRIYIPSNTEDSIGQFQVVAERFDSVGLHYEMKFRRANGVFSDSTVIWINRNSLHIALTEVASATRNASWVAPPPPLAFNWSGIGLCTHPADDGSAGWMYSELLWSLVRSGSQHNLIQELLDRGFDPSRPWRLNKSMDAYWDEDFQC